MYLIDGLFSALSHFSEQSKVLASNVANLNTPQFKAKSLTPLSGSFLSGTSLACTSSMHISSSRDFCRGSSRLESMKGEEKPNGNSVDILQQMSAMSENGDKYELSMALFKGAFDFFHIAHGSSR
jgi:flagellar basal-body rod protein FlgB